MKEDDEDVKRLPFRLFEIRLWLNCAGRCQAPEASTVEPGVLDRVCYP
jgi:hypothetical protein